MDPFMNHRVSCYSKYTVFNYTVDNEFDKVVDCH